MGECQNYLTHFTNTCKMYELINSELEASTNITQGKKEPKS